MARDTYLFTSESVSEGHPDKVADQISDAILDEFLRQDPESKVACETFCTRGSVIVMGEVHSEAYVDIQKTVRDTIARIGYTDANYMFDSNSCGVLSALNEQSSDIRQGVDRANPDDQGAGDQGMMFGYACRDTADYMPLPLALSHLTLRILSDIRHDEPDLMPYLRPDAKCQYTVEYDARTHKPLRIHTIVLSTQHDEFTAPCLGRLSYDDACVKFGKEKVDAAMHAEIERDVREILLPRVEKAVGEGVGSLFKGDFILHVNPTGKFVIGGPAGDTGLTGRKIIVDTYGGKGAHGGGAFSGKDPSKVDRSGAYMARYIAKNLVAAGVADEILVQIAYAIGVASPVSVFVDTYGTAAKSPDGLRLQDSFIASKLPGLFDLRPAAIIRKFSLKNPIYSPTASYGHFGRKPYTAVVKVIRDGREEEAPARFFAWEDCDSVPAVKKAFNLQ